MRLRRRAARFVGGSLDGETTFARTRLVYLRLEDGWFEEYRQDGRHYVYAHVTKMRDSSVNASVTLERQPAFVLVPV